MIHEGDDVLRHQAVAVDLRIARGAAVTAAVHGDDLVLLGKLRYLAAEIFGVAETAMEEDERRAITPYRVINLYAVHRCFAALAGRRQGLGCRQGLPQLLRPQRHDGEEKRCDDEGEGLKKSAHDASP
jgi:hypothetical protein